MNVVCPKYFHTGKNIQYNSGEWNELGELL